MSLSTELENRGFINQFSGESLAEILDGEKRTIYLGVDPTADSIHAGNFVIYMLLRRLADAGHSVILLAGGGTGRIGDPKPDVERPLLEPEEIDRRVKKLQAQAEKLLNIENLTIVDNNDWLGELKLIEFLRDIGKHFTVGELIKKDAIATRLASDVGLSYTEFAYPLLQGYDFLELYRSHGCDVQVGGSDQWGNIVAGVDLIRRKEQATSFAITVPLVVDKSTGKKFGKSEGNAVWLDAEKTSPYQFYQFWLNTADENVLDYLKLFTTLSLEEIEDIRQRFELNPGEREAQKTLAFNVTELVHGTNTAHLVRQASEIVFGGGVIMDIEDGLRTIVLENAPTSPFTTDIPLVEMLVSTELASSKREARTFIDSGAIKLNGEVVEDTDFVLTAANFRNGLLPLSRGKKKFCILVQE